MRILIVDDSSTMRKIVLRTLRQAGYESDEVLEAGDGVAGLSVLDAQAVDLIFSDVNMPNMNGLDFVSEVRKRGATTPIVMVTTEGGQDSIADALQRGANGYVVKPFTPDKLGEVLTSVLK